MRKGAAPDGALRILRYDIGSEADACEQKRWRFTVDRFLGEEYEIFRPEMPCANNAKYAEWKVWFEKLLPHLGDGVTLAGHSLGAIFLVKYLSENIFPKEIGSVFLLATPHGSTPTEHEADFTVPKDMRRLMALGSKVHLYHSKDDPVVPFSHFERYQKELPKAQTRVFVDKGHFKLREFPELIQDIQAVR